MLPPSSVEPAGGVYCSVSADPTGASTAPVGPSSAYIGALGVQLVELFDPSPGVPVIKLDHPSLGAGERSGVAQDTWIHWPAYAAGAIARAARAPSTAT